MSLLLDQNLSHHLVETLSTAFPGCRHVRDAGLASSSDEAVWRFAAEAGLVVVTKDSDFVEHCRLRGSPPKVAWLRCGNVRPAEMLAFLQGHSATIQRLIDDESLHWVELR